MINALWALWLEDFRIQRDLETHHKSTISVRTVYMGKTLDQKKIMNIIFYMAQLYHIRMS